jgi:hypothetical protein
MSIPKHLDQSPQGLREASARIEATRQEPFSLASAREWLETLTDFTSAADIQTFTRAREVEPSRGASGLEEVAAGARTARSKVSSARAGLRL